MGDLPYCRQPCAECPWRQDVKPGKFPPSRFLSLITTAVDRTLKVFACHMTSGKKTQVCAGFLLSKDAAHNLTLRLSRQLFDDVKSAAPLHATYRRMAVANGVPADHGALNNLRKDCR